MKNLIKVKFLAKLRNDGNLLKLKNWYKHNKVDKQEYKIILMKLKQ